MYIIGNLCEVQTKLWGMQNMLIGTIFWKLLILFCDYARKCRVARAERPYVMGAVFWAAVMKNPTTLAFCECGKSQ